MEPTSAVQLVAGHPRWLFMRTEGTMETNPTDAVLGWILGGLLALLVVDVLGIPIVRGAMKGLGIDPEGDHMVTWMFWIVVVPFILISFLSEKITRKLISLGNKPEPSHPYDKDIL